MLHRAGCAEKPKRDLCTINIPPPPYSLGHFCQEIVFYCPQLELGLKIKKFPCKHWEAQKRPLQNKHPHLPQILSGSLSVLFKELTKTEYVWFEKRGSWVKRQSWKDLRKSWQKKSWMEAINAELQQAELHPPLQTWEREPCKHFWHGLLRIFAILSAL